MTNSNPVPKQDTYKIFNKCGYFPKFQQNKLSYHDSVSKQQREETWLVVGSLINKNRYVSIILKPS
jgi:hypothetical protein